MPFESKRQWRAAFAGKIPGISPAKAHEWAHETKEKFKDLPDRAPAEKGKPTLRSKSSGLLAHAHDSGEGIAKSQIHAGEKVELEHTKKPGVARQIAIDHLRERPDYYGLLEAMEKKPLTSKRANGDMLQYFMDHPDKLREKKERDKKANFKLDGERKFRGLDVAIENKKGSKRSWYDPHGKEKGSTHMHYDYGYIRLTKGTDGDHVDVYIGPDEDAENVFIVDQMKKPDFKKFDEQKVMLGFKTEAEAKAAYLKQYNDPGFFGSIKTMPFEEFKTKVLDKSNHGEKISMMYIAPSKIALSLSTVQSALAQRAAQGIGGAAALGRGIASAAERGATSSRGAMQQLGGLAKHQLSAVAEGGTALRKTEQALANPVTQAARSRVLGAVRDEAAGAATRTGAPLSNAYEGYMTSSQHAYSPEHLGQVLGTAPVHLKTGPSQLATQVGTAPGIGRSAEKTVITPRSGVRPRAMPVTEPTMTIAPKVATDEGRVNRIADRLDDLGIGVLAAPAASHLAEIGTRKLMLRGGRLGGLAAIAHGPAEQASKFFSQHVPEHATELGGLALVAPGITHSIAHAADKLLPGQKAKTGPQEPLTAGQADQMVFKRAEEIGRALAREKTAINVGGIAGAVGRAAWNNRRTLAGIGAAATVGAGLYGAKKTVDAATNLATEAREPARYAGVPPGMRPPAPVTMI